MENSDSEDSNRIYWDRRGQADGVAGDADLLRSRLRALRKSDNGGAGISDHSKA